MPPPRIIDNDTPHRRHQMWACWSKDEDAPAHAAIFRTDDGRLVVKGLVANAAFRGRDMLLWLREAFGLPIHVVEVIPSAAGFWKKMKAEGIIADWEESTGFASPLERDAIPLHDMKEVA